MPVFIKFPPMRIVPEVLLPVIVPEFVISEVPLELSILPVLKVIVPALLIAPLTVILPELNVIVPVLLRLPFTVSVLVKTVKVPDDIERLVQVTLPADAFIVNPPSIKTASPFFGTEAPLVPPEVADQVEVEPQLPVATEYRFAPSLLNPIINTNTIIPIALRGRCNFFIKFCL